MSTTRSVISLIAIVLFVALALYVGGWVMFVGGIVDAVGIFKGDIELTGMAVAIAIVRIFGGATVGTLIAAVGLGVAKIISD